MTTEEKKQSCPQCGQPIPAEAPNGICPSCALAGAVTESATESQSTNRPAPPPLEAVAQAFPNLEIIEIIGQGGMGTVFKAKQTKLDRIVALKILPVTLAADPHFAERFAREGKLLARLNHPNIVTVFDFGQQEDFYFLLMEYVDGVNLRQAMQSGKFSPQAALELVPKICEALQYAHAENILHRDIKPENILLSAGGGIKIADFGIAKLSGNDPRADVTLTSTGHTLGTPHYMAPEQLENPGQVDHRADIYSLGVVFYEMLTGELPIGRFDVPSAKTSVSDQVDQAVLRALEKDPKRRQDSVGTFNTELHGESGESPAPSRAKGTNPSTLPKFSKLGLAAGITSAIALVLTFVPVVLTLVGDNVVIAMGFATLPGILVGMVGTVLGWVALSDIREHRGQLRGLPITTFGAVSWPILVVNTFLVGLPYVYYSRQDPPVQISPFGWSTLLTIASIVTFVGFYAAARWGARKPIASHLGRTFWIVLGLILLGIILTLWPSRRTVRMGPVLGGPQVIASNHRMLALQITSAQIDTSGANPMLVWDFETEGDRMKLEWQSSGSILPHQPAPLYHSSVSGIGNDVEVRFNGGLRLELPADLTPTELSAIEAAVEDQWTNRNLTIVAGQTTVILSIQNEPDSSGTIQIKATATQP